MDGYCYNQMVKIIQWLKKRKLGTEASDLYPKCDITDFLYIP
jgi:hypothetical protein